MFPKGTFLQPQIVEKDLENRLYEIFETFSRKMRTQIRENAQLFSGTAVKVVNQKFAIFMALFKKFLLRVPLDQKCFLKCANIWKMP